MRSSAPRWEEVVRDAGFLRVAFRADSRQLAVASETGNVTVYETSSGREAYGVGVGFAPIRAVAFHPTWPYLALSTGKFGLPLNSMNGPMLGVNDAKWTTSRNPRPPPDMCGTTGSPAAAAIRATCVARMNPPP